MTDALLDVEGLTGNAFLAPNVVGTLNVLPRHRTFVHGRAEPAAFVELKLPAVALAAPDTQRQFVERATAIVLRRAGGRLTPAQVWVNVVHAVDGGWGIAGRRYDNASLVDSIQSAAAATQ
ncbi:Tautomerase enzyme [Burkholderia stabilis]|uniref:Tautomerase enzyme n=1 Tax=Burkholderia stabilis TaxID=95485 RepID=UPI001E4F7A96|nr:Tautomerase enzyme [Burkholderia stabilis]